MANANAPLHSHPALEELAQTFGCHLVMHRLSDPTPCFASRSVTSYMRFNGSGISITEMLHFLGRQRFPVLPCWNTIFTELGNSFDSPQLLASCLTDLQGSLRWCAASYGLLPTPYDKAPVLMAVCYELDQLGPMHVAHAANHCTDGHMRQRFAQLSQREKEVLALMLAEQTTGDIARQLHLSRHTVNTHRKNLMQKLEARTNMALTAYRPFLQ
jgi:DNA-binding CsgD family transcriptional regulator